MLGIFYETQIRDEYTGNTVFTFAPLEQCSHTIDGLLTCEGVIPPYKKSTPLCLDGYFSNGRYMVKKYRICQKGKKECELLIKFVAPEYKGNIPDTVEFLLDKGADYLVSEGLDELAAKRSIKKIRSLLNSDTLYQYLSKMGVACDRIEDILAYDITLKEIRNNPYRHFLYRDIPLSIADKIMQVEHQIHPYAPQRLISYVKLAIFRSEKSGNSCTTAKALLQLTNYLLGQSGIPSVHLNMALLNFCLHKLGEQVVWQDNYIYSKKAWQEETLLINDLKRLQNSVKEYKKANISEVEKKTGITYTEGQREAFRAIEKSGVKILTGPPGTGKSIVIQGIIEAFEGEVRLSATTGRAAQVLGSYCNRPAETVHKLLDIRPFGDTVSSKNINNPLEADLVVVDEFSMSDLELTSMLFHAIKSGCILLLVGDEDQLQSVGYGNVLHDLIGSGMCEVYRLKEVKRFDGIILENAKRIMLGNENLIECRQFQIKEFEDEDLLLESVVKNKGKDLQVISSIKKTKLGTYSLNKLLQPSSKILFARYGPITYYDGDKVIFTATNYKSGYWNGEIGTLVSCDKESRSLEVNVGNRNIVIQKSDLHDLALAYAITTHKCQGSGFDNILVILPDSSPYMLTRRLLYTAVTRARKRVTIYSIKKSLAYAINNQAEKSRISILKERIQKE